jgi:hypothetical protein
LLGETQIQLPAIQRTYRKQEKEIYWQIKSQSHLQMTECYKVARMHKLKSSSFTVGLRFSLDIIMEP